MDYQIQITESFQRRETVSASSATEAVKMVRQYYKEEKIVLDSEDFTDVEFTIERGGLGPWYRSGGGGL